MDATSMPRSALAQPIRKRVLTTAHAAAYLDCSKATLYRAARAGLIHPIHLLNNTVRWDVAELDAWVAARMARAANDAA